jgi:hypothetical protein
MLGILSRSNSMRGKFCAGILPLFLLGIAVSSEANVNSLSAGVDVGLDMDHYTYKNARPSGTTTDRNRIFTSPSLTFKSNDIKEGIDFTYAPSFRYDWNGNGTDVDQSLNFLARKSLLKEWQIKISELYVKSDDTTLTSNQNASTESNTSGSVSNVSNDQISNELGRHRFWSNNASLFSDYTYLQDSVVSLGYTYSVLRNDGTNTRGFQDYDKHSGLASVSYRFLPAWKGVLGGQYVRGLYGTQQLAAAGSQSDLSEYHGNMSLESYIFEKNVLSVSYGYIGTRHDDTTRKDNDIHNATLGWKRDVSPHVNFDFGGGPSLVKTEGQDGNWGYNAHAKLNYLIEHGKFGLGAEKAFSQDNFSGTSNGGTIDSWSVKGDFNYQLYKELSTGVFASYTKQDHQNATVGFSSNNTSYHQKVSSTGVNMKYSFWRWYTVTVGYTFSRQEADSLLVSSFDENRIYLTLGAQKELLRW